MIPIFVEVGIGGDRSAIDGSDSRTTRVSAEDVDIVADNSVLSEFEASRQLCTRVNPRKWV